MQVRRYMSVLWLLLGAFLAACAGGSGSSGFDAFPQSENAAIQQALDEQHCVAFHALSICPADTTGTVQPAASSTPEPTATPTGIRVTPSPTPTPLATLRASPTFSPTATPPQPHRPSVDTGINGGSVACAPVDSSGCVLILPFAPDGFPPGTVFRVAVRTVDPPGSWSIGADVTPTGSPSAPAFDAPVAVDTVKQPGNIHVQLGVLAFLKPPQNVPAAVENLGDSGADYAFVTAGLNLQPIALDGTQ